MSSMAAPSYQLNANEAREGSGGGRGRIADSGAYEGILTKAKHITAQTGASGVEFEFESNSGEGARFTLYTLNKDGQPIYGSKQLQALMAVLKQRTIAAQATTIEEYDYDARAKKQVQAHIYPQLMNKPVGIVFQMEEYISTEDGLIKTRPNFFAPFDPVTKQLAVEILDAAKAEKLAKILPTLKTKTIQPARPAPQASYAPPTSDQFDDDIPF